MPEQEFHGVRIYAPIETFAPMTENGSDVVNRAELAELVKDIQLDYGQFTSREVTTTTVTANQVLDSVPITTARTIKYIVQASTSTEFHTAEVIIVHNGTTVFMSEFGTDVMTGETSLLFLNSDLNNGNVRLLVTPTYENTNFKIIRTIIAP